MKKKLNIKAFTLTELLISVALLVIVTPLILMTLQNNMESYTRTQNINDTTANIANFIQNFKNLVLMTWVGEFRENGNDNGDRKLELADYSMSAPSQNDSVYFSQKLNCEVTKLEGWCKVLVRSMTLASNPNKFMEIVWFQCPEGDINNPGQLGDTGTEQYVLLQNVQRIDWKTTNKEPIFRLFYNDPKDKSKGAAGVTVKCLVSIPIANTSDEKFESVLLETGVYFKNNTY